MPDGQGLMFLGIFLVALVTVATFFAIRRWRYHPDKENNDCSFGPNWLIAKIYGSPLHWKHNVLMASSVIFGFFIVPPSVYIAACANHGDIDNTCAWSLKHVYANNGSAYGLDHAPAAGGVGFGFAVLILECFFAIFVSLFQIRWYSETDLNAVGEFQTLKNDLGALPLELQYEYEWLRWMRVPTFIFGIWVCVFGFIGRCILWALVNTAHQVMDGYTIGACVVVIMFSLVTLFINISFCCHKTWWEKDEYADYTMFSCSTCSATGKVSATESCTDCNGTGHVWKQQNACMTTPVDLTYGAFPVKQGE